MALKEIIIQHKSWDITKNYQYCNYPYPNHWPQIMFANRSETSSFTWMVHFFYLNNTWTLDQNSLLNQKQKGETLLYKLSFCKILWLHSDINQQKQLYLLHRLILAFLLCSTLKSFFFFLTAGTCFEGMIVFSSFLLEIVLMVCLSPLIFNPAEHFVFQTRLRMKLNIFHRRTELNLKNWLILICTVITLRATGSGFGKKQT